MIVEIMYEDLLLENYNYELPSNLIADRPTAIREECRLLVYRKSSNEITHTTFDQLEKYLPKNAHLVLNSSKVTPCRLTGAKSSGGVAEIFVLDENEVLVKCRGNKKVGGCFTFEQGITATITEVLKRKFVVEFKKDSMKISAREVTELIGTMPIPPYIRGGKSDQQDSVDYQTVYADEEGSVAAPTAGLHFSKVQLASLKESGIDHSFVTLHVGHGTFAPVKAANLSGHIMHEEFYTIPIETAKKIEQARDKKRAVIAVGTTSLRALESAVKDVAVPGEFVSTDIFIYPGKDVTSVNGLITNFHLPKSTLLMLVSSLIGRAKTLELYQEAVKKGYRFYSYGDAMLLIE